MDKRVEVRISASPPPIDPILEEGSEDEHEENSVEEGRKRWQLSIVHVEKGFVCHAPHQIKDDISFVAALDRVVITMVRHNFDKVIAIVPKFRTIQAKHQLLIGCLPTYDPNREEKQEEICFAKESVHGRSIKQIGIIFFCFSHVC